MGEPEPPPVGGLSCAASALPARGASEARIDMGPQPNRVRGVGVSTGRGWGGQAVFKLASHRVRKVDELDLEVELGREPAAQSEDAESLGGVVAGSQEVNAVLGSLVHDPL